MGTLPATVSRSYFPSYATRLHKTDKIVRLLRSPLAAARLPRSPVTRGARSASSRSLLLPPAPTREKRQIKNSKGSHVWAKVKLNIYHGSRRSCRATFMQLVQLRRRKYSGHGNLLISTQNAVCLPHSSDPVAHRQHGPPAPSPGFPLQSYGTWGTN